MNSTCWVAGSWIFNSWVDGSWCPIAPIVIAQDILYWGPHIVLYQEGVTDMRWLRKIKKEDEEYFIL